MTSWTEQKNSPRNESLAYSIHFSNTLDFDIFKLKMYRSMQELPDLLYVLAARIQQKTKNI
jgi:hypothetical protein